MSYTYLISSLGKNNPSVSGLKQSYVDSFQEILNNEFYNASDIWTIQEEFPAKSGLYQDVSIRLLSHVINNDSGNKLGDDYKKILFKDIDHSVETGTLYKFNNSYWICINNDRTKQLAASCIIKRCNNLLRWVDLQGGYHAIPCSIDYLINENRDYSTAGTSLVLPAAQLEIMCQFNDESNLIKPNQRFLFGNKNSWSAYKVLGGGVNNFNNLETENNMSNGFMRLSVGANYVNLDTDDIENGIADALQMDYSLSLSESSISGTVTSSRKLIASVSMNGLSVDRDVVWESSNPLICTVDSTGLVQFISNGSASVKCSLLNNSLVYDSCSVLIQTTPVSDYQIFITPDVNYILQNEKVTFNAKLYLNGILQPDVFSFSINPNLVPSVNYEFNVIDGNNFSIKNNKKELLSYLTISCLSGLNLKQVEIQLRGAY